MIFCDWSTCLQVVGNVLRAWQLYRQDSDHHLCRYFLMKFRSFFVLLPLAIWRESQPWPPWWGSRTLQRIREPLNSKARQLILKKHQLNYLSGLGAGVVGSSLWSFVLEHFGERERARVTYIYILWFENVYLIYISYLYCYINIVFPFSRETEWIWAWRNGPILWLIWVEQVQIFNFNRATDFELWDLERQYPSDMCLGCDFQIFAFHFQVMQVGWEKSMNFRISHLFRCYGVQRAGATLGQLKPCSSMLYLSPVQAGHATSPALRGIQGCRAVRGKEMVF